MRINLTTQESEARLTALRRRAGTPEEHLSSISGASSLLSRHRKEKERREKKENKEKQRLDFDWPEKERRKSKGKEVDDRFVSGGQLDDDRFVSEGHVNFWADLESVSPLDVHELTVSGKGEL